MSPTMIAVIVPIIALALGYVLVPVALNTYRRIRSPRYVICPETAGSAKVELGGVRAAVGSAMGMRWLKVARCGRWPERKECDQRCLHDIDTAWAENHWLLVRDYPAGPGGRTGMGR